MSHKINQKGDQVKITGILHQIINKKALASIRNRNVGEHAKFKRTEYWQTYRQS